MDKSTRLTSAIILNSNLVTTATANPLTILTLTVTPVTTQTPSATNSSITMTTTPVTTFDELYGAFAGSPGDEISSESLQLYSQDLKTQYREYLKIEIIILYTLLISGSLTNLFALFQIAFKNHHKTGSNILLLNLVIVDLFVVLFTIFPQILWCQSISWEVGQITCKLYQTLRNFSLFSSSFMVICISYNRYYLLKEPHIFQKEKQRAYRMLKITYISSFLLSIPQFIIFRVVPQPDHNFNQCVGFTFFTSQWQLRAYNFYTLLGMYLIPLQLIILLYSKIIASLNLDKYVVARMSKSASSEERLSQKTNCMLKTKRKAISTFLAVTISFTVCWTPYAFIVLWQVFSGQDEIINPVFTSLMYMFALLSCTLNPIVNSSHLYRVLFCCKRSGSSCQMVNRLRPLRGRANGSDLKPINCSNDKANILK